MSDQMSEVKFRMVQTTDSCWAVLNPAGVSGNGMLEFFTKVPSRLEVLMKVKNSEQTQVAVVLYTGKRPKLNEVLQEFRFFRRDVDLAPLSLVREFQTRTGVDNGHQSYH